MGVGRLSAGCIEAFPPDGVCLSGWIGLWSVWDMLNGMYIFTYLAKVLGPSFSMC